MKSLTQSFTVDIRELKLLADFNHPNIVRLVSSKGNAWTYTASDPRSRQLGVSIPDRASGTPCMVITELCENGDLFDYIRNVPAPTFVKVLRLMINIAEGLEYLHERKPKVIHRDCKSTNILINRRGVAKVADFGLARVKSTTRSVIRSLVGTVNWQAPELWHPNPKYDYKVDVFSCAMVYWEMLSGWVNEKVRPWWRVARSTAHARLLLRKHIPGKAAMSIGSTMPWAPRSRGGPAG